MLRYAKIGSNIVVMPDEHAEPGVTVDTLGVETEVTLVCTGHPGVFVKGMATVGPESTSFEGYRAPCIAPLPNQRASVAGTPEPNVDFFL